MVELEEAIHDNFSEVNFPHFHESGNFILDFFMITTCCEIIIGNLLVIVVALKYKCFGSKSTNRYIISLAISDLLIGVIVIPLDILEMVAFRLLHEFQEATFISSIFNLTVVSMDRYLAIKHPIRYSRILTTRKVNWNVAIVWLLTFAFVELPDFVDTLCIHLVHIDDEHYDEETFQICDFTHDLLFMLRLPFIFYIPLIMMISFNYGTYRYALKSLTLQERRKKLRLSACSSSSNLNNLDNPHQSPTHHHSHNHHLNCHHLREEDKPRFRKLIRQNKLTFTLVLIMATFILFWAPVYIILTTRCFCTNCTQSLAGVHYYAVWLAILNSGVNPIIHFVTSKKFRKAVYSLFCVLSLNKK